MLTWQTIIDFSEYGNLAPERRIEKDDSEWQTLLTSEQFAITRKAGTERPFSNDSCSYFESGDYYCVCCDSLLFDVACQFDSGSGWPSFTQPATDSAIAYHTDNSRGMTRMEAICNVCDAHLGHVFPDGPPPSGLRYCMNAVAMVKKD